LGQQFNTNFTYDAPSHGVNNSERVIADLIFMQDTVEYKQLHEYLMYFCLFVRRKFLRSIGSLKWRNLEEVVAHFDGSEGNWQFCKKGNKI